MLDTQKHTTPSWSTLVNLRAFMEENIPADFDWSVLISAHELKLTIVRPEGPTVMWGLEIEAETFTGLERRVRELDWVTQRSDAKASETIYRRLVS